MTWSEALLTFGSLFLAAVFAFYLDSLRERRRTKRWVFEYLRFWSERLRSYESERGQNMELFSRVDQALGQWLVDGPGAPEPEWVMIDAMSVNTPISFTPSLFGEALEVVSPQLLRSMFEVDAVLPQLRSHSEATVRLFEQMLRPLVLRRQHRLDDAERRAVEQFRREMQTVRALVQQFSDRVADVVAGLSREGI